MELLTEYVDPVTLTGFARTALAELPQNQFALGNWLPNQNIDDIDFRINRDQGGLAETAKFRSYDTESPISGRRGVERIMGQLPPISEKKMLGEYARLRLRRLTTNDPVMQSIFNDVADLVRRIATRLEVARGEALVTGKLEINENDVQQTVEFGRSASMSVAPAVLWSADGATPLSDLLAWFEAYVALNGVEPGAILTSRRVVAVLMRNEEFRALVASTAGTPTLVSRDAVNTTLAAYGLPPIATYDVQVRVNGQARRVVPDDLALLLPAAGAAQTDRLGATFWGTTLESQEPAYSALATAGQQAGIVAGTWKSLDPISVWTHAAAIGLPVLANPNRAMVADVL